MIISLLVDDQDRLPRLERQGVDPREIRERNILIAMSHTRLQGGNICMVYQRNGKMRGWRGSSLMCKSTSIEEVTKELVTISFGEEDARCSPSNLPLNRILATYLF